MTTNVRPITLSWTEFERSAHSDTAVGRFSIEAVPFGSVTAWVARLNRDSFPILFSSLQDAQLAAHVAMVLAGDATVSPPDWVPGPDGGSSAHRVLSGTWHCLRSEAGIGTFILHGDRPAVIPHADAAQARDACQQYVSHLWFALTDIAGTPGP